MIPVLSEFCLSALRVSALLTTLTDAKATGSFFELIILKLTGISWARTFDVQAINKEMNKAFLRSRVKKLFMNR
jgi:hypothetical protein